jgi:hypothetical protein
MTTTRLIRTSVSLEKGDYDTIVAYGKEAEISFSEATRRLLRPSIKKLRASDPLTMPSQQP